MTKLYHSPLTRSTRVYWLLEELGLPYELEVVDVYTGKGRTPEYKALHPHGYVPALEWKGEVLLESAAMLLTLADEVPGFAPELRTAARAKYNQWMVYFPATADPQLEAVMFHTKFLPEAKRLPQLVETATKRWRVVEGVMGKQLADGRPYFLGESFSAVDVLAGTCLAWARMGGVFEGTGVLGAFLERMSARPAFQKAHS